MFFKSFSEIYIKLENSHSFIKAKLNRIKNKSKGKN